VSPAATGKLKLETGKVRRSTNRPSAVKVSAAAVAGLIAAAMPTAAISRKLRVHEPRFRYITIPRIEARRVSRWLARHLATFQAHQKQTIQSISNMFHLERKDFKISRGDAHQAKNFTGVRKLSVEFVCENNRFAWVLRKAAFS
jgi:hypothetical protein